jgi:nucleoside phosphorylase/tetratricopeptide (TPR) repeat protein
MSAVADNVVAVVLTAIDVEYRAVRERLSQVRRHDHPAGTVFETGLLPGGQGRVALAVTGAGNAGAAVLAERAIAMFDPAALLFVGVAGGLSDDLEPGDVIVATKVYAVHGGREGPDGFRARPRSWEAPHRLEQIARHVAYTGQWKALLPLASSGTHPRVLFRPIAAGEVVLDSRSAPLSERLHLTYNDAAAIEMESAGVSLAAHLNHRLPALTVRGISDLADGAKYKLDRDGWQTAAAANAAAVGLAIAADLCAAGHRRSPAAQAVPMQLPMPGGLFVGREEHLSRLDDFLLGQRRARPRVAVLTGMAGVGKTALALRWADRAAAAFPDGVLYVDARGFGPDPPLSELEILAGFLRALGQTRAAQRGSVTERAARFRTLVSGLRLLIMLDNVASVEQVRPLLPGAGDCAVLVTSRHELHGLAVHWAAEILRVRPLPGRDALALLRAAIGNSAALDEPVLTQLAACSAGLPLGLRIAAQRVNAQGGSGLPELLADLDDAATALDALDLGDDPYTAVRTVFSWSYRALDAAVAAGFRLLGMHPANTFALPAAAATLGLSAAETKLVLRTLVNAHLLAQPSPDRFQMHDLLRTYARELSFKYDAKAAQTEALQRLLDQYVYAADRASRAIMPHRHREPVDVEVTVSIDLADRDAAVAWCDAELHNLTDLCRLDHPQFDGRRWQLAFALRDYFYLTKNVDDWIATHTLAAAAAQRMGDRRAEAIARNNLGRALLEAQRLDDADREYLNARRLFEQTSDAHGYSDTLINHASILRRQGKFQEALTGQLEALAYYRRHGIARKVGIALRAVARSHLGLGHHGGAVRHAREALEIFLALGLHLDAAQTLTTLGEAHHSDGDTQAAVASCQRAIEYSQLAKSEFEEARALHRLGKVTSSEPHLAQALEILRRLGATLADTVAEELHSLSSFRS